MKRVSLSMLIVALLATVCRAQEAIHVQSSPQIEVYFSPHGGCTQAIVKELIAAKSSVQVQAYSFTSVPIAKALVDAHKRGVKVEVILDKSQRTEKYSEADFLVNMGIPTKIDTLHAIAHNKVIIVDGQTIITGSFNFTKAAEESNAENLLVIKDKMLADKYAANWKTHAEHSDTYTAKEKGFSETHRGEEPAETVPVISGYVSSVNSQVFHKVGCKSAAKILKKNLVHYNTRQEAVEAGKRPCANCNP